MSIELPSPSSVVARVQAHQEAERVAAAAQQEQEARAREAEHQRQHDILIDRAAVALASAACFPVRVDSTGFTMPAVLLAVGTLTKAGWVHFAGMFGSHAYQSEILIGDPTAPNAKEETRRALMNLLSH